MAKKKIIFEFDREEDYIEVYNDIFGEQPAPDEATITETDSEVTINVHKL